MHLSKSLLPLGRNALSIALSGATGILVHSFALSVVVGPIARAAETQVHVDPAEVPRGVDLGQAPLRLGSWARVALPSETLHDAVHVGSHLVLATPRGAYVLEAPLAEHGAGEAPGIWSTLIGRTSARQLAIAEPGLWIATESGLLHWDGARRARRVPEVGAPVQGVANGPDGALWVVSQGDLLRRDAGSDPGRPGGAWQRSAALPDRPVTSLHAELAPGSSDPGATVGLWAATPGALWQLSGDRFKRRLAGLGEGWWELAGAAHAEGVTWLAVPEGLLLVRPDRVERVPLGGPVTDVKALGGPSGGVVVIRDERALCIGLARSRPMDAGRALALSRIGGDLLGVLEPQGVRRVGCPLTREALEREGPERAAYPEAATPTPPPARVSDRAAPGAGGRADDPRTAVLLPTPGEVARLHAQVLRYLDLTPEPLRKLDRRSALRGLWPELRLGMAMDARRQRADDRDQTFSSGEIRNLLDQARDSQREAGVEVQLIWRLGDLADPADLLAISKERRERIELREQVLERVDQVFFERARLRARLQLDPGLSEAERIELEIRVRELAATLDAWTGGAFSRLAGGQSRGAPRR